MTDSLLQRSHRRRNALTGEWVMVSPQRAQRPWQGEESPATEDAEMTYDPHCYLCPGNTRANGDVNAPYTSPWAFENDFPAVAVEFEPQTLDATDAGVLSTCLLYTSDAADE